MKMSVIIWIDAYSDDDDNYADELKPGMPLIASGLLIKEDKEALYLAVDYDAKTETWRNANVVPKSLIVSRADIPVPGRVMKAWERARKKYE